MSSNSSWVPDEGAKALFSERCWFQGAIIAAIAYGITVALFFLCIHQLFSENSGAELRRRLPLLIYIIITILLGTLYMISCAAFTQMAFIDNRNYPGGPDAYESKVFAVPIDFAGCIAFVTSNWLSDALLVWRFKVIYQECSVPIWAAMLLPCLMLAASGVAGIFFLLQVSVTNPFEASSHGHGGNLTVPYTGLSLALNIILTAAIVLRLLTMRYRIVSLLGRAYGTKYTSISSIITESAALYSAVSVTFLVLFGIGNPISEAFIQFLNPVQTVAALLIVFRVSRGKAWAEGTASLLMTTQDRSYLEAGRMRFASAIVSDTLEKSSGKAAKNGSGGFHTESFSG